MVHEYQLRPLPNPDQCEGYPPSMTVDRPQCEINFLLDIKLEHGSSTSKAIKDTLACSLIVRVDQNYSNDDAISTEKLPSQIDKSKPVIIICHGSFSWRNQMLISNLASKLCTTMDLHTLRFDFTGNGHSPGEWKYFNVIQDYIDLCKIVDFVKSYLKCEICCIIGHSFASTSILQYAATNATLEQDGLEMSCIKFVNLAGRFITPNEPSSFSADDLRQLKIEGCFYLKHPFEDRRITKFKITKEQMDLRNNYDTHQIVKAFGRSNSRIRVLTIHGNKDKVVNVVNANKYDKRIANHTLHVIDGASHNFNGTKFHGILVEVISSFLNQK